MPVHTHAATPARSLLGRCLAGLALLFACHASVAAADPAKDPTAQAANQARVFVRMETSLGDVVLELDPAKAPITVKNFLAYTRKGTYDGTVFHRVIPRFMVQGGGFEPDGTQRPSDRPIKNEAANGLSNDRGTIAMARTSNPDSATNQFFINVNNNTFLNRGGRTQNDPRDDDTADAGYAVFGKVVKGMDVVDRIVGVETETRLVQGAPMQNWPAEPVVIKKVTVLSREQAREILGPDANIEPASADAGQEENRGMRQRSPGMPENRSGD